MKPTGPLSVSLETLAPWCGMSYTEVLEGGNCDVSILKGIVSYIHMLRMSNAHRLIACYGICGWCTSEIGRARVFFLWSEMIKPTLL